MHIVCAYCLKPITDRPPAGSSDISHGICDDCMRVVLADNGNSLQDVIEKIAAPVLVVSGDADVLTANAAAQKALGRPIATIRGYRSGDVIECVHARKPGGCGRQDDCKLCVIRNSVLHTATTGEPVRQAIAVQTVIGPDGSETTERFSISTNKEGRIVLLRIDEILTLF